MIDGRYAKLLAPLAIAATLVAGCGGSADDGAAGGSPSSTGIPSMTDDQNAPARVTLDVEIAGGKVTPTNAQLRAKVGQPIVIRVNSDAADELHVHSNPEHSFPVEAKAGQQFQFTVEVPGRVDVELHELDKTVATFAVEQ